MKKFFHLLNQPFPVHLVLPYRLYIATGFSALVLWFIWYFDMLKQLPVDTERKTRIIFIYGLMGYAIVLLAMYLGPVLFRKKVREGNWRIYNNMIGDSIMYLLITFCVTYYNHVNGLIAFGWSSFFTILQDLFFIAMLPITVSALLLYNYSLRKNLKEAAELQAVLDNHRKNQVATVSNQRIILIDSSGKELLNLSPDNLLLLRSADNYVDVFWKDQERVNHTVLRKPIKQLEEQLADKGIFYRCHRTCIININKILKISGNSLGCRIRLEGMEDEIPVSRSNRHELMEMLTPRGAVA